jgi:hypothetical protein
MTNDKGVTISMNRIYGWGHWNYPADAQLQWDFMKQYARDTETGEIILLNQQTETPETPETPSVEPETPVQEETPVVSNTPAAAATAASTSGVVNTAVSNNAFGWMGTMMVSLGAAAITLLKRKED